MCRATHQLFKSRAVSLLPRMVYRLYDIPYRQIRPSETEGEEQKHFGGSRHRRHHRHHRNIHIPFDPPIHLRSRETEEFRGQLHPIEWRGHTLPPLGNLPPRLHQGPQHSRFAEQQQLYGVHTGYIPACFLDTHQFIQHHDESFRRFHHPYLHFLHIKGL